MGIVCQQTILIKYHALFVIFEKAAKFEINCCLLQIIGGALWVNTVPLLSLEPAPHQPLKVYFCQELLSTDPRFIQCIYRYCHASKRFVEV